ncbi:hypothetical protein PPYR_01678 [Photinus pyralis]|uniref:Major facilitator superfamily (MFS) profile domain-containing protein n=1 Tax=Photinus pyralis TaxID=7054 RepID=A0A1Y1L9H4_PHOPY|nr:proton-coupled folate transporter-like [Photinus pyralis]XP_031329728.1 proton-coupled folate transporter-like [Photinus pyralis]KAB0804708.1 hypothetical protein PPYR_01678 [Photinus pyralis]
MTLKINIELPVFLLFFSLNFSDLITKNFVIYSTCYITLKYNQSDCALLGINYTDNATALLEQKVQPHAAVIFTCFGIIQVFFAPIMCFLLGPWSDKYGRKPVLIATLGGLMISSVLRTVITAIPNISPWYLLIGLLPSCIVGGLPAAITVVLCYIVDVTDEQERVVKMYIFEGLIAIGTIIGSLTCSEALITLSYAGVFGISTLCVVVALLYVILFVPESVQHVHTEGKLRSLFCLTTFTSTVKTIIKRRENYSRGILIGILAIMTFSIFILLGEGEILFLYLREIFGWNMQLYTFYNSIVGVVQIFGGILSVCLFRKVMRLKETTVIGVSFVFCMMATLMLALAREDWQIYVGGTLKFMGVAISPMARSLLSKVVPSEETGKVFSMLTALETVGALLGNTIYTAIYKATLDLFPSAFFFVSIGVDVIILVILSVIIVLRRYDSQATYAPIAKE